MSAVQPSAWIPGGKNSQGYRASVRSWLEARSLTFRVMAAASALLAVLLLIVLVTHQRTSDERRTAEVSNAVETGEAVAGIVDGFARDLQSSMAALSLALAAQGQLNQSNSGPYLAALAKQNEVLRAVFITDTAGRVMASDSGVGVGVDLSARPYIKTLADGAPEVWGPSVRGIESGEVTLTIGRRVVAADQTLRGFMVAAFYAPAVAGRLAAYVPTDADVTLFDQAGQVIFSTQRTDLPPSERDQSDAQPVSAALRGSTVRLQGDAEFFDDPNRFGAVAPLPTTGWAVAFTRPLQPLDDALRRRLLVQIGEVSLAVVVVAVALAFATRRVMRPLRDLVEVAGRIERGEHLALLPPARGGEPAQLVAAMAAMAAAVSEREAIAEREIELREQFLGTAAHELKTPLTVLKGYSLLLARQLERGTSDSARLPVIVRELVVHTDRLEELINDLLDVSRIQRGRLELRYEERDLVALARDVIERFDRDPRRDGRHILSLAAPSSVIAAFDPHRLEQVLVNLVDNAIKYSPDGGEVRVRVERDRAEAAIAVEDEGLGISREDQARLFQPFMRLLDQRQVIPGTGLGLYISSEMVRSHGGSLTVESELSVGTTFTVRLPLEPAGEARARPEEHVEFSPSGTARAAEGIPA